MKATMAFNTLHRTGVREEEKERILKEFEKDLEIYRKNVEAIRAIVALHEYDKCCDNSSSWWHDSVLSYLADRVKITLEDPDVKIDYKGRMVDLKKKIEIMQKGLLTKYEGKISNKTLSNLIYDRTYIPCYSKKKDKDGCSRDQQSCPEHGRLINQTDIMISACQ